MFLRVFRLLWALLVQPLLDFFSPRHALKFARPTRRAPDPKYFPYYFQNAQGLWLRWAEWVPRDREPKGVVFLVQGLAEHTGRYDSIARRFNEQGYVCFSHDHQGQGLSEGERKHIERFAFYVDDLQQFVHLRLNSNDGQYRKLPRFIFGHSMGGLIATHICMREPGFFEAAVLSAPALVPDPTKATPLLKSIARLISNVMPKVGLDDLDPTQISRNPQVYELYVQDPGVPRNKLRARWATEMFAAMDSVFFHKDQLTFPFLVVHGSDDRIVLLEGSEKLMQAAPAEDKKICVYRGGYHELLTDDRYAERVYDDIFAFLKVRLEAASP